MFKRILLPSDFSSPDVAAVSYALELARDSSASIALLHVIEELQDTSFEDLKDFYREIERSVRARMDAVYSRFTGEEIPCEQHIVYGNRVQRIVEFSANFKAELIVLQSHQVTPDQPFEGWGGLSYKVAVLAPCPVLLVK